MTIWMGMWKRTLCAVVLVSGSIPAIAADTVRFAVAFVPPVSWVEHSADPGGGQTVVYWLDPAPPEHQFRQNINLLEYPLTGTLGEYITQSLSSFQTHDATMRVISRKPNAICPEGSSEILMLQTTNPTVGLLAIEQVLTRSNDSVFIVTYTRAAASDAKPEAANAVEHACPFT